MPPREQKRVAWYTKGNEMSNVYSVPLVDRKEVAFGTMAFSFERPKEFVFEAGQHLDLTLKNPLYSDDEGSVRTYSIASSPNETRLTIATRMRNTAFKNSLREMPLGAKVQIQGPMGSFTLHKDAAKPAVFLAGGIGVTPMRSIITYAVEEKLPHRLYLFYSNRRPEDATFLEELVALEKENPNYTCVPTMTEMRGSRSAWPGLTAYIDAEMIGGRVRDAAKAIYYIAGPAAMVTSMRHVLDAMRVSDEQIRTEEFGGY